ncbi:hypothetical protein [Salinisphaera sp. G21_0]|uniref:hypothetical protein n=1 Tax=Salinisphaera sp. G21_0 TaxID=2821094 RepID=UPI001ADCCB5D|nr:hypothetical protein [Salinisphaera sp. G21_0]MBO9483787.1 hypothetical protein [Salinisphaera sp. G21_0]
MKLTALAIVLLITGCQSYTIAPEVNRIKNSAVREAYKACSIDAQINGSDEEACKQRVIKDLIQFGNQVLINAKCVKQYEVKKDKQL